MSGSENACSNLNSENREREWRTLLEAAGLIPTWVCPAAILPPARRWELLKWARRKNSIIVENDHDAEFRDEGRPLESLQGLDTEGRIVCLADEPGRDPRGNPAIGRNTLRPVGTGRSVPPSTSERVVRGPNVGFQLMRTDVGAFPELRRLEICTGDHALNDDA